MKIRAPVSYRASLVGLLVSIALVATSCGPTLPLEINVRERPVDVVLGSDRTPAPDAVAAVPTTGLGFISPSVPFFPAPGGRRGVPPVLTEPCPKARLDAAAEADAPAIVQAPPAEGMYIYRRSGYVRYGDRGESPDELQGRRKLPLSGVVAREVKNVQVTDEPTGDGPTMRFDVVQQEQFVTTTTSYVISPPGAVSGTTPIGTTVTSSRSALQIARIEVQRSDLPADGPFGAGAGGEEGTEVFEPQPPVRLMDLPAAPQLQPQPAESTPPPSSIGDLNSQANEQFEQGEDGSPASEGTEAGSRATRIPNPTRGSVYDTYGVGNDPSGAWMKVYYATVSRINIDICGRVIQAWRVRISFPEAYMFSQYERDMVRWYQFSGEFIFATQFALIVKESFHFMGEEPGGRPYEMETTSTITSLEPR